MRWPEGPCHHKKKHHKTRRRRERQSTEAGLCCETSQNRVSSARLYGSLPPRHGQKARTTMPGLANTSRIHALAANKSNYKRAPGNSDHFSASVKWRQDDLTRVRRQDAIRTPLPRRRICLLQLHKMIKFLQLQGCSIRTEINCWILRHSKCEMQPE